MGPSVTPKYYGMKISTLLNATQKLTGDLSYLCSLIEHPDGEFQIVDAVSYAGAVTAVSRQLLFITEDIADNDLSDDQEYVKLSEDDIVMMNSFTEAAEEAIEILEERCGISLRNN